MTDESQAPAGRETDAAVARAMGWTFHLAGGQHDPTGSACPVPPYSADTPGGYAAMREMLTWLNDRGIEVTLEQCNGDFNWAASHRNDARYHLAESLPLAVCRLVLAVAQSEVKNV